MTADPALRLVVLGRVQGVGFRWWAIDTALGLGLRGWVRNRRDGSVEVHAIGPGDQLDAFARACESGPAAARVTSVERFSAEDDGTRGFEHRGSA
jgi:acylphosphatase